MATSDRSPLKFIPHKKQYKLKSFDRVIYDEARQQLLLFKNNRFSYLSVKKSRIVHTRQITEQPHVIAAACSVDQRFIARQISPTKVEVFDFYTHESNTITCRAKALKRRNSKISKMPEHQRHLRKNGLLWCKFEDLKHALVLVTGLAVEIYAIHSNASSRRRSFVSYKRSLPHFIQSVCFYPFEDRGIWQGVLLLCTGATGTQCQPYLVNSAKPAPLQKFEVSRAVTSMRLVSLYGSMYLICIEAGTKAGSPSSAQHCLVYRIRRRHEVQVIKKYVLAPGPVDILAVDNLVCILHWRDFHGTLFDIKAAGHREVVAKSSCRLAPPSPSADGAKSPKTKVKELTVELPCTSSLGLKLKCVRGMTTDSPEKTRAFCVVDGFHRAGDQNPAQPRASSQYLGTLLPAEECGMIERGHHLVAVNSHSVLDLDFKEALQLVKRQFVASAETQRCSIRLTFRTRLPDGFQRARLHAGSLSSGDTNASFRSLWPSWVLHETKGMIMQLHVDLSAIVDLKRLPASAIVGVLQRRQIRSSVSAPPRLSVSPQKSKSSHGKPPRSSAPEPAELDAKKLVAGALRTWIAKRELDQVEARKVFEKINNALKSYRASRSKEKRGSGSGFTREKRNLSFTNMTTDLLDLSEEQDRANSPKVSAPPVAAGSRRTADGLLVLSVDDMFRYVFYPAAQASAVIARGQSPRRLATPRPPVPADPVISFLLKEYPKQMPSYAVVKARLIDEFGQRTFALKKQLVQALLHSRAQARSEPAHDVAESVADDGDALWSGSTAAAAATQETRVHAHYLVSVILEYIASLQASKMMPSTNLCLLLVTLLAKVERYDQLLQLIQYHILPDSADMAKRLLSVAFRVANAGQGRREAAMALRQVALDMLYRLKDIDSLVGVLLRQSADAGEDGGSFAAYRTALAARWQFKFRPTPSRVRRFAKAAVRESLVAHSPDGAISANAVRPLQQLYRFLCRWSRGVDSAAVWTAACEYLSKNLPRNLWLKVETLFTLGPLN